MSGWTYEFTSQADRDIARLDPPVARRIIDGLERLVNNPDRGSVRRLTGRQEHRLRVGDWRVLFDRDYINKVILVLRILHRREAYRE